MAKDLGTFRKTYEKSDLDQAGLPGDPLELFQEWFHELEAAGGCGEPNAMTIATAGPDGYPKSRVVLLKEISDDGFVFFTNYESDKGRAIAANPRVCLSFYWPELERQVIVKGKAEKVAAEVSDRYFASRPRGSKLGALVSDQSRVIASREELDRKLEALDREYRDKPIHRPGYWGGYLVRPDAIEFWQGRPNRLHDRMRFGLQEDGKWIIERLAP